MADVAISGLTALGGAPATNDLLVEVDVSDTTQAPTGTTKKMTVANLFTSPTMTTVTISSGGLTVSAGTTAVQALTASSITLGVTSGSVISAPGATTGQLYGQFINSAGNIVWGVEDSVGGTIFTGGSANAAVLGTTVAKSLQFATSGTVRLTISSAGAIAIPGDFAIATSKFTVASASGNTAIAGTLIVQGATATMPLLVGIGGLTAAFPALKRSGATLEVRAADDSGYTNLNVSALSTATGDVFSQTNVTASTGVFKVGANQVVGARSTGWATQTVTTGAKTDIGASGTWTTTSVGNLLMAHHAALLAHGLIGA